MTAAGSASGAPAAPGGPAAGTGERAVPYACPFCAEDDLRPLEPGAVPGLARGGWHCRSCLRVFTLTFHGVHRPAPAAPARPTQIDRPAPGSETP